MKLQSASDRKAAFQDAEFKSWFYEFERRRILIIIVSPTIDS
jgi:hypothetical protein